MTKDQMLQKIVYSESLDAAVAALIEYILGKKAVIDANIANVLGKVTTLIGSDTAKSVRTIANEELASQLIPESAQEALDTLQEIAAWIQAHPADAAAMNTAIGNLQDLVGTLPQDTEATTVVGYITAEIAALASTIQNKNVSASGETGDNALISASASNNAVSVSSTAKLQEAVAAAETAKQDADFGFLTVADAQTLVADAIAAAESSSSDSE